MVTTMITMEIRWMTMVSQLNFEGGEQKDIMTNKTITKRHLNL